MYLFRHFSERWRGSSVVKSTVRSLPTQVWFSESRYSSFQLPVTLVSGEPMSSFRPGYPHLATYISTLTNLRIYTYLPVYLHLPTCVPTVNLGIHPCQTEYSHLPTRVSILKTCVSTLNTLVILIHMCNSYVSYIYFIWNKSSKSFCNLCWWSSWCYHYY